MARKSASRKASAVVSTSKAVIDLSLPANDDDSNKNTKQNAGVRKKRGKKASLGVAYPSSINDLSLVCSPCNNPLAAASASATVAAAASAAPPTKKAPPKPKKAPEEKRLKRFRASCPKAIWDRIERAKHQRMYLIQKSPVNREFLECEFSVLGSTGNVYQVKIAKVPHCSCPDHAKGNLCKHILFVLLKVMSLDPSSHYIYQAAYLSQELQFMFQALESRRVNGNVVANAAVQASFSKLTSGVHDPEDLDQDNTTANGITRKELTEDDCDCPICFDPMPISSSNSNSNAKQLTYCKAMCGSNFHLDCIQRWIRSGQGTCPNCRQPWVGDGMSAASNSAKKKAARGDEGYTNLGHLQGQSPDRDTSTYSEWYNTGGYKRRRWY